MARHQALFYDYVPNMAERRGPHREDHIAHIRAEREAGRLVMAGALGDPPHGGLLVFGDVDETVVATFVDTDPYMRAGLITAWRVEPWNIV